jgi:RHS repeat-associated protein
LEEGAVVESYSYDVYGRVAARDGTGTLLASLTAPRSRWLFTGREFDSETGLYDYRARAYSPELGRFLQMDPIDFDGVKRVSPAYLCFLIDGRVI